MYIYIQYIKYNGHAIYIKREGYRRAAVKGLGLTLRLTSRLRVNPSQVYSMSITFYVLNIDIHIHAYMWVYVANTAATVVRVNPNACMPERWLRVDAICAYIYTYDSIYARRMGQPTQRATNYTARSNIDTAQIFLHANGQSAPRPGSVRGVGRGAGSHTPSTATESFSYTIIDMEYT